MKPIDDKLGRPSYTNKKHKGLVFIRTECNNAFIPEHRLNTSYYIAYRDGKRAGHYDDDYPDSDFKKIK